MRCVELAGGAGDLSARLDTSKATGDYKVLGESVNSLLSAVSEPIYAIKDIVSDMAKGDISKSLDMELKGDLKEMKDSLNMAIDNMNGLLGNINEMSNLVSSSSEEMLSKAEQMKGSTGEMSSAVQQMAERSTGSGTAN